MRYLCINGKCYTCKKGLIGCYKHSLKGLFNGMDKTVFSFYDVINDLQLNISEQTQLFELITGENIF